MDGACFPHSAYPVPMTVNPYPTTDWGWEIFETPWTVQSLWWHYTYTRDKELLSTRLYPVMREAASFCTLRVKGAFLIDAECAEGKVTFVRVYSECGGEFRLENPWSRAVDQNGRVCDDKIICIQMQKGEEIVIRPFENSK